MENLELITKNVYGEINEKSIVIFCRADLNDVAPFMCSPYTEDWFWSNSTNEIIKYIFEVIISNYLINDVMAFGDYNNIENQDFDFNKSIEIYKNYKNMNNERTNAVNKLIKIYKTNIDKELSYFELIRLLIDIETVVPNTGVNLEFDSFSSPLETRHSKNLKNTYFDFENLGKNF